MQYINNPKIPYLIIKLNFYTKIYKLIYDGEEKGLGCNPTLQRRISWKLSGIFFKLSKHQGLIDVRQSKLNIFNAIESNKLS